MVVVPVASADVDVARECLPDAEVVLPTKRYRSPRLTRRRHKTVTLGTNGLWRSRERRQLSLKGKREGEAKNGIPGACRLVAPAVPDPGSVGWNEAPEEGLEPPTRRLTAACSTS